MPQSRVYRNQSTNRIKKKRILLGNQDVEGTVIGSSHGYYCMNASKCTKYVKKIL